VLAQTYSQFEYILVDNCSTDGSSGIAQTYSFRDPRIRYIQCTQFLPQLQNYNRALAQISEDSEYCKIVQADDWIFPDCLQLMVETFERSKSIGLVSSYCQVGDMLVGACYPYWTSPLPGGECARWYLRTGFNIFGSQTTVMYRSSLVRQYQPFYDESFPNADVERCMEILKHCDFGFVRQVLSYTRRDNESITSTLLTFQAYALDRYVIARRHAPAFFDPSEAATLTKKWRQKYYRAMAKEAIRFREAGFWRYHRTCLMTLNETLSRSYLAFQIILVLLWTVSNPGSIVLRALRTGKCGIGTNTRVDSVEKLG
jgi:glycosyltransferase involved in cell wall biosynthesis